MGISEKKMQIVINNYFKQECDVNTSIREAFEKGLRIGVKKGQSAQRWIPFKEQFPKDGQRVLVQMENGYTELIDFSAYGLTSHLVAWIPLPEPYKGGEQEWQY